MSDGLKEVDELVDETVETIEETVEEVATVDENSDVVEALEEATVATTALAGTKKVKKHIAAKEIIAQAKHIIQESEQSVNECKLLLENDLRDYNDAKKALKEGGLEDAKALLVDLNYATMEELDTLVEPNFEIEDTVEPIYVRDVSSGRFTGFILSLVAGTATVGGLVYMASQKLGLSQDWTKIPNNETIDKIANWYTKLFNLEENTQIGLGIIGLIVLLVMLFVYVIRVAMKGSSNLHFAHKQMEETEQFVVQKDECKAQMEKVDTHIHDAIAILKDYQVLLHEQSSKLLRIKHFESEGDYSISSKKEMQETQGLISSVQTFIAQPIIEKGKFVEEASNTLIEAKEKVEAFLRRFV